MPTFIDDTGSESLGLSSRVGAVAQRWGLATGFDRQVCLAATCDPSAFSSQAVIRAYTRASKEWQLAGTNAADASSTQLTTGGIQLTTGATSGDQMIVSPLVINSVQQSPWGWVDWTPDRMPSLDVSVAFSSSVASVRAIFGFKLTTALDYSTDADHCLFVLDTALASNWRLHSRVATVDENRDAVSAVAKSVPQTLTRYDLSIRISNQRRPVFLIDGQEVGTGPALTAAAAFKPVLAVQTLTSGARDMQLLKAACALNI